MQFLFPGFLWALFALAIPIILHLFYFRRYKKVYFSNVRFLREVKEETSARNKLRNLLVLIARCLALAFLVFAFAQPFIPVSEDVYQGRKNVSLFVDNSYSMQSFGEDLPLLDRSKQKAMDIIAAYGSADKFQVITHELRSDQQRYLSQDEAIAAVEEIEITPSVAPISNVIERQKRLSESDPDAPLISYLISDFQESIVDVNGGDSTFQINLVPVQSVQEKNIAIDTAWFDVPAQLMNQTSQLVVQLTNYSEDDVENVKLTSSLDGQEKPVSTITIPANQTIYDTVNLTIMKTGWHQVILRVTDFPVQFDDSYFMTFYVLENVRIAAINDGSENPRLTAAFANNPNFNLDNISNAQINYSALRDYDLLVLNDVRNVTSGTAEELYSFMENGGRVIFFPAPGQEPGVFSDFLTRCGANTFAEWDTVQRVAGRVNTDELLFRDVFINTSRNLRLPVTESNYTTNAIQARAEQRVITYRDGSSLISKYDVGRGSLIISTAPLADDFSNLARNAEIFIPLLYNAAVSVGREAPNAYTIGKGTLIEVPSPDVDGERVFTFKGDIEFIPGMTPLGVNTLLDPAGQIETAGFYELYLGDDYRGIYAFNFDRRESALAYIASESLAEFFGDDAQIWEETARASFSELIAEQERGIVLWRWCIILALAFLGLEILLIRFWKT